MKNLEGASAFVPIECDDGRFEVRQVQYGHRAPRIEIGSLSFSAAEDLAFERNREAGISPEVWGAVEDYLKNADV